KGASDGPSTRYRPSTCSPAATSTHSGTTTATIPRRCSTRSSEGLNDALKAEAQSKGRTYLVTATTRTNTPTTNWRMPHARILAAELNCSQNEIGPGFLRPRVL